MEVTDLAFLVFDGKNLTVNDLFLLANLFLELLLALISLRNGLLVAAHSFVKYELLLLEFVSDVFVVIKICLVFKYSVLEVDLVLLEFFDVILFLSDALFQLVLFEKDLLHGVVLTE